MRSPKKQVLASCTWGRIMSWKTLSVLTMFLFFIMESSRFGKWMMMNEQQQQSSGSYLRSDELQISDQQHHGYKPLNGGRQLLKKMNYGGGLSSSTTTEFSFQSIIIDDNIEASENNIEETGKCYIHTWP
jgi:hypothetical protein